MKIFTLQLIFLFTIAVYAQKDCSIQTRSLMPLTDLNTDHFRGFIGGLYSDGTNIRSGAHLSNATAQAALVELLDLNGVPSSTGSMVMIGVGASNPRTEFENFAERAREYNELNPNLYMINTCIGGQGVQKMNQRSDNYWTQAKRQLADSGLSALQVQVAWIETENTANGDTTFPQAPQELTEELRLLLETMHAEFPNLRVCYLTARAFSGFVDPSQVAIGRGLMHPRDYYNGWAIKWAIQQQQANAVGWNWEGAGKRVPFITWGPYLWTDGSNVRSDGHFIDCEADLGSDGLHLSAAGEVKNGAMLFQFFTTDVTSTPWFNGREVHTDVHESTAEDYELLLICNLQGIVIPHTQAIVNLPSGCYLIRERVRGIEATRLLQIAR